MNEAGLWWKVKVYDSVSRSYTYLSKYGELESIIIELKSDGLWEYVSATPETE